MSQPVTPLYLLPEENTHAVPDQGRPPVHLHVLPQRRVRQLRRFRLRLPAPAPLATDARRHAEARRAAA